MKRVFLLLLVVISIYPAARGFSYAQSPTTSLEVKSKQIIVTFRKKPQALDLLTVKSRQKKSKAKFAIANSRAMVYETTEGNLETAIRELGSDPLIESAVADRKLFPLYLPNDPGIRATPAPGKPQLQWDMYKLNLAGSGRSAWDVSKGSNQIVVAVLDSGIDSQHPELSGKIVFLVDCSGASCQRVSTMTADPNNLDASHGTHVAGIIGATTDNGSGVTGSGFNTSLMPIKIQNASGEMLISSFLNGIRYAADNGAKVINMSLGSLTANLDPPLITQINEALNYAWGKNVLLVAAAGNCGWPSSHYSGSGGGGACDVVDVNGNFVRHAINEKYYPAAAANVISVAATDINNQRAEYSEHNDSSNPQIGNWVSVVAPGGMFTTTADKEFGIANTWPGGIYFYNLGTSSAAPHVSGIAALILAKQTTLTNVQLKSIIEQTASRNIATGVSNYGMVNALAALDSLSNVPNPTSTIAPSNSPTPGSTITPIKSLTPTLSKTPTPQPIISITKSPTPIIPSPTRTPVPTIISPTLSRTPSLTPNPQITPANCKNNPLSASCFWAWISEYTRSMTSSFTDYNHDGKIDLIDFEFWRRSNL